MTIDATSAVAQLLDEYMKVRDEKQALIDLCRELREMACQCDLGYPRPCALCYGKSVLGKKYRDLVEK